MADEYVSGGLVEPPRAPLGQRIRGGLREGARAFGRGLATNLRTGGLETAYLMGRGEYGAASASRERQQAQLAQEEALARQQAAMQELEGIDPATPEGSAEAFRILLKWGLNDAAQAVAQMAARPAEPPITVTEGVAGDPKLRRERVMTRGGAPIYEGAPYEPSASTQVIMGGSNMTPEQAVSAEERSASRVDARTKELREKLARHRQMGAVLARIQAEGRAPTPAESDTLIKLASRIENPETVGEGDVARKGGSLWNAMRSRAGLPAQLTADSAYELYTNAGLLAEDAERELAAIEEEARSVAASRGLNPRAVAPPTGAQPPAPPSDGGPAGLPEGARVIGQLQSGAWIVQLPDGNVRAWEP